MNFISTSSLLLSTLLASALALPAPSPQKSRFTAPLRGHRGVKRQSNGAGEADDKQYGEPIAIHWTTPVAIGGYTGNLLIDSGSSDL